MRLTLLTIVAIGLLGCPGEPSDGGNDAGPPDPGPACPAPSGAGTTHTADIQADTTWTAAGSPHTVDQTIRLRAGNLTIEPCAEVRLAKGVSILAGHLGAATSLRAIGTAEKRITFKRKNAADAWGSLQVNGTHATAPANIHLAHVTLEGGGDDVAPNLFGRGSTIIADGNGAETRKIVRLDNVSIKGSGGLGVWLKGKAAFADESKDVTISGSGATFASEPYPLRIDPGSLGTIPTGTYTGNGRDEIYIHTQFDIPTQDTIRDRGVPYRVQEGYLRASPPATTSTATLTIEPGVTLRFARGRYLWIGSGASGAPAYPGVLIANGTAAQPIRFTSAEATPAAGDWVGILMQGPATTGNSIQHAIIEYAGADCSCVGISCATPDEGALHIWRYRPSSAFVSNTVFRNIAGHGIVSGWNGAALDFRPTNTFTSVSRCQQTLQKDLNNACPNPNPQCL